MFYVIQTNTNLSGDNSPIDFQSIVFEVQNHTWEEFKKCAINNTNDVFNSKGTMEGSFCFSPFKTKEVIINDDTHLEVILTNGQIKINSKFYKVSKENFNCLIS